MNYKMKPWAKRLLGAILAAAAFCAILAGCAKDKEKMDTARDDPGPPDDYVETPKSSTEPDVQELWASFQEDVQSLRTYRDNRPEIRYPLPEGAQDFDPTPYYTESVITLKNLVYAMSPSLPDAEEVSVIIEELDFLLMDMSVTETVAKDAGVELSPTGIELGKLRKQAVNLQEALLAQSAPPEPPEEEDELQVLTDAVEDLTKTVQNRFHYLDNTIDGMRDETRTGIRLAIIAATGSALCLLGVVIGIFRTQAAVKRMEKSASERPTSAADMEKLLTAINRLKVETQDLRSAFEALEKAGQNSAPKTLSAFKWDSQNSLSEVSFPGEFSGEPTGVPGEFRIWPDFNGTGASSRDSQELSRNILYFGYVKDYFDITPATAGNYQAYSIQVRECAVIRKERGTRYRLLKKGRIQAKGVS